MRVSLNIHLASSGAAGFSLTHPLDCNSWVIETDDGLLLNVSAMLDSIRRLSGLAFESFLPGHGAFALRDGMRHVARARSYADHGQVPPSLF